MQFILVPATWERLFSEQFSFRFVQTSGMIIHYHNSTELYLLQLRRVFIGWLLQLFCIIELSFGRTTVERKILLPDGISIVTVTTCIYIKVNGPSNLLVSCRYT